MTSPAKEQVLDAIEAARLIFNTAEPSEEQVAKVEAEIRRGALRRSRQGGLTTTAEGVANYFASKAAASLVPHSAPAESPSPKGVKPSAAEEPAVTGVYQTMLKDYFLGIFLQRQSKQHPDFFQKAILAGQILLFVGMLAILAWAFTDAAGIFSTKSPGQVAVEKWIAAKHGRFELVSISPGAEETDLIVKFRYRANSGKQIETQQVFRIEDGNVSIVVNE